MKKMKKIAAWLVALMLLLAGCGGSQPETEPTGATTEVLPTSGQYTDQNPGIELPDHEW